MRRDYGLRLIARGLHEDVFSILPGSVPVCEARNRTGTPPLYDDQLHIRLAEPADLPAAYYVCLKTGDHGRDGEPFYQDDPDALGRIFVGPTWRSSPS